MPAAALGVVGRLLAEQWWAGCWLRSGGQAAARGVGGLVGQALVYV